MQKTVNNPSALRTVSVIISVLLAAVIFGCLLAGVILGSLSGTFSDESIENIVDEIPFSELPAGGGMTLAQFLSHEVESAFSDAAGPLSYYIDFEFSPRDAAEILESRKFKSFVAEKLSDYLNDIKKGKSTTSIEREELVELVSDVIKLDSRLPESAKTLIYTSAADEILQSGINDVLDANLLKREAPLVYLLIRSLMSSSLSGITFIIAAVCAAVIFALNFRHLRFFFISLGLPITLSGTLLLIVGGLSGFVKAAVGMAVPDISFAGEIVSAMFSAMILPGIILTAAGLILAVSGFVIKERKTNVQN